MTAQGLPYSQRLSNIAPGQMPVWTLDSMQGQPRIEGVAVLLPDGTVFLCSGAESGEGPSRLLSVLAACPHAGALPLLMHTYSRQQALSLGPFMTLTHA